VAAQAPAVSDVRPGPQALDPEPEPPAGDPVGLEPVHALHLAQRASQDLGARVATLTPAHAPPGEPWEERTA
jgi:hypothetical protein